MSSPAYQVINWADICQVISNIFLLLPAWVAWKYNLVFTTFLFVTECIVSTVYHICVFSSACLFGYSVLHNLDFFFAQLLIVRAAAYLIFYPPTKMFWEWIFLMLGCVVIIILEITLPGDLAVQAGIVGASLLIVIIYWFCNGGLPDYDMPRFYLGILLIVSSVLMFCIQGTWPDAVWAAHSLWHISASLGFYYLLQIKPPASIIQNAASPVHWVLGQIGLPYQEKRQKEI